MSEKAADKKKAPPPKPAAEPAQGRASLCVFTNRSMPFKTLFVYCTKFYPETWLAEKQKTGVRLPYPYVLQYEIVIQPKDWPNIKNELKPSFAQYQIPSQEPGGEHDMVWLNCRSGYVIRTLRKTIGWRRRIRHQYFNLAFEIHIFIWTISIIFFIALIFTVYLYS